MENSWEEVRIADSEKRRELTLHGAEISERIEKGGFDETIYKLKSLNFLDISKTCLTELTSEIGKLENLTNLVLHNNKLTSLPQEVGDITKLKLLDISNNDIASLPDSVSQMSALQSFNASMNKMTEFPSVEKMLSLHILNISNNQLTSLPDGIYNPELVHLSQIVANNNEIAEIEPDISELPHLNLLNLESNKLISVPSELSECLKLKDLNLKGNKFKDRRFGKLVEQCPTKSVIDYLSALLKKENAEKGKGKGKSKDKKKKRKKVAEEETEKGKDTIEVLHLPDGDKAVCIAVTAGALSVRQYIVCCIVRQIDFTKTPNAFKNFITLQTKLHDTTCVKRKVATIATHDLKSVKHPLTYDAKFPPHLLIKPLLKQKEVSGEKLMKDLVKEAEDFRKEKKRNTLSGIHQYLELLRDKSQYPCLMDKDGVVISFPPITNSDVTKMSKETTDMLVEVTSSTSLDVCKKVLDELLIRMLEMNLGRVTVPDDNSSDEEEASEAAAMATETNKKLVVEQVKVTDMEGNLRVIYPSRTDLLSTDINVIRHFD